MSLKPALTPLEPWIARKIGAAGASAPLTRRGIEEYQLARLRDTLRLVRAHSPFYRAHLAHAPKELRSLQDLARFPFTTATDLRENGGQFLCVSQSDIRRVVTLDTSGTTGNPKRLYFTAEDQDLTVDFFHIGMSTLTAPGDRVLILLPSKRPGSVGDLLATALRRLGAEGLKHGSVRDAAETWGIFTEQAVNVLVGAPVQALALARYGEVVDAAPPSALQRILLTTDHVPRAIAKALERIWDCEVYNHYGMTEMGLGGGVECQARRGYHLREADLYFEIVDPTTGTPLPEGERGEVVFTTLTRRGMPLIRYRTGDMSRFIPGACLCGTLLRTLERVTERVSGRVAIGAAHHLTIADLDEVLFSIAGIVDFAATITRAGDSEHLHIHAVVGADTGQATSLAIMGQLHTLPAIQSAQKTGQLEISVEVQIADWHNAPGYRLAKRQIRIHT